MSQRPDPDERETLRQARERYFRANGLGADGGYADSWVKVRLGPIPFAFPNTAGRVRAVRFHDLHHVVTGYATDVVGEAEIAAWEVGSGCDGYVAAWVLNLYAMAIGLFVGREPTWRAFVRGRRSGNLYHEGWREGLLDESVGAMRSELALDRADTPAATSGDRALFGFWLAASLLLALATLALLAAPLVLLVRALV